MPVSAEKFRGHSTRLAPPQVDLVGAGFAERGVRRRSAGYYVTGGGGPDIDARYRGAGSDTRESLSRIENRAVKLTPGGEIRVADPGLWPGADTMSLKLSRGLSNLDLLGSAGILMTEEGVHDVREHFRNVIKILDPDYVTTPTWNTAPFIFDRVQGDPRLPEGMTAEKATKLGVQIVRETLDEADSDATMLLSVRPTGNTLDGDGTLPPEEIEQMLTKQFTWLKEAAGSRWEQSVLTLETESTGIGAKVFAKVAQKFEHPYMIMLRPNDEGYLPDGSSYGELAEAVDSEYFVGGGFNCQTIDAIRKAMRLASEQGANIFTLIAEPNGADGYNETLNDDLQESEANEIRLNNVRGLLGLREEFGTVVIGRCCNSTDFDIKYWREELHHRFAPRGIVYERGTARQEEHLVRAR